MAFGVKVKTVETSNTYTIETLYEAIKDKTFTAGEPSLAKDVAVTLIVFPALDRQNQVQISRLGFKAETKKFSIQKGEVPGLGNMVANGLLDKLTGGLFSAKSVVGSNVKRCEELIEITAKELEALNL